MKLQKRPLREQLAYYAHDTWSRWIKYMFYQSRRNADDDIIIPEELADRWIRQSCMFYDDLTEKEKESDRLEADKILAIIGSNKNETKG